jgi:hypothetical protein
VLAVILFCFHFLSQMPRLCLFVSGQARLVCPFASLNKLLAESDFIQMKTVTKMKLTNSNRFNLQE